MLYVDSQPSLLLLLLLLLPIRIEQIFELTLTLNTINMPFHSASDCSEH